MKTGEEFSNDFKAFAAGCGQRRRMQMFDFKMGKLMAPMIAKMIALSADGGKDIAGIDNYIVETMKKVASYPFQGKGGHLKRFTALWKKMGLPQKDGKELDQLFATANCMVAKKAAAAAGTGKVLVKHILSG